MSKENYQWLEKELPSWVSEGLVTQTSANVLLERYAHEKPHHSALNIAFSLIGFALVGLGIVSIFAYNWDTLGHVERTILALGLLLGAQAFGLWTQRYRANERALVEGSAFFWFLMIGAALAIIGQTYHLGGTMLDFLSAWLALGFVMPWLLSSSSAAIGVSLLWASVWVLFVERHGALLKLSQTLHVPFWLLLGVFVSTALFYARVLRATPKSHTASLLGWATALSCLAVLSAEMLSVHHFIGSILLLCILFFALYYLLGKEVLVHGERFYQQPFTHIGKWGVFAIMLWHLSFRTWHWFERETHLEGLANAPFMITVVLALGYLGMLGYMMYRKKAWGEDMLILYAPIPFWIGVMTRDTVIAVLLINAFFFAASTWMIVCAAKTSRLGVLNQGMILIALGVWIHFFDSHLGLVTKGVAFIATGVLFLGVNAFFKRRLRSQA
jgi:uncharacterized membrane protein